MTTSAIMYVYMKADTTLMASVTFFNAGATAIAPLRLRLLLALRSSNDTMVLTYTRIRSIPALVYNNNIYHYILGVPINCLLMLCRGFAGQNKFIFVCKFC